jgi:hypothetical protein
MQKQIIPFTFKAQDDEHGIFTGDANVIGIVDLGNDRVMPGAFAQDLRLRGSRRPLLWGHDMKEIIGTVDLVETPRSLRVPRGQLALGVQRAREAYELLKIPGAIGGMSIGYISKNDRIAKDGVREVLEVELLEVSLVAVPMNPESRVDSVKNRDAADLQRSLESLSRSMHSARSAVESYTSFPADPDRLMESMAYNLRKLTSFVS